METDSRIMDLVRTTPKIKLILNVLFVFSKKKKKKESGVCGYLLYIYTICISCLVNSVPCLLDI